jgi:CheY-like chemotaxis protein
MAELLKAEFRIKVLVIDRDKEYAAMLSDLLSKTGVCIPEYFDTIQDAKKRIDQGDERVDVCVLEVLNDRVNEAAIGFIRNYVKRIPCIVLTQSESAALGAQCSEAGAKKVIDKKNFDEEDFVTVVSTVSSVHLINPGFDANGSDTYDRATGILLEKCPVSVTAWAELTGITDRQLRGLVKKKSKISAKDALYLAVRLKKSNGNKIK